MEINVTREEFIQMYETLTCKELQEKFNLSYFQLLKFAKKLGLKKQPGRRVKDYTFKDE